MRGLGNRVKGSDGQVLYYTTAGAGQITMIWRELRLQSGEKGEILAFVVCSPGAKDNRKAK
jgi:hypothetical protein